MSNHPLKCSKCTDFRKLEITYRTYKEELNKEITIMIPFFSCPNCGDRKQLWENEFYEKIVHKEFQNMNNGEVKELKARLENQKFPDYDYLELKYSILDYYLIPGLSRPENDGFLIPVFFDKDVLLWYNGHPDYKVVFGSFSTGNIYQNDESLFRYGFGVNRNGKIFMWLGDIQEEFSSEEMKSNLKRFQASNVDSDHDIYSKYYLSQNPFSPSDAFQESDNEVKLFEVKNLLDETFKKKYDFTLTKIKIEDIFDFYKPPILEEKEQIFNAFVSLNKFIIENIQIEKLKEILINARKKDLSKLGSLKTLEKFLEELCKIENIKELLSPFYVLYDLRILQGHLSDNSFEEKYNFCKERLGLQNSAKHFEVYSKLIERLIISYEEITLRIKDCS